MESRTMPPPQASARQTEMGETFNRVLFAVLDALQERSIPHGLIGGVAASGLGRPRSTHDIDIFVRPEDAEAALVALAAKGFETERTDPRWLFKGWLDEMMVDIIFKSSGDIYFDDEMHRRCKLIPYHGRNIPAVSPEDMIIIKCAVHSELGPHHWHDALAILSHATLDYNYLLSRARRATRRVLALLIYAQSNDIWIPNDVIQILFQNVFNNQSSPSLSNTLGAGFAAQAPPHRPEISWQEFSVDAPSRSSFTNAFPNDLDRNGSSSRAGSRSGGAGGASYHSQMQDLGNGDAMKARHPAHPPSPQTLDAQPPRFSEMTQRLANKEIKGNASTEPRATEAKKETCAAYMKSHLHEALASDARTAHLDCELTIETSESRRILMAGDAPSHHHRTSIEQVIRDHAPGFLIENQIRVFEMTSEACAPVMEELV